MSATDTARGNGSRKRPLIGITCHADTGGAEDLWPGSPLSYIERKYSDILAECGMLPLLIPVTSPEDLVWDTLSRIDGLLAAGGGKIPPSLLTGRLVPPLCETAPERYRFEARLYAAALDLDMPIIGMCRGMQMINEILGGTMFFNLLEEIPGTHEHNQGKLGVLGDTPVHGISVTKGSLLSRLLGTDQAMVNSFHRQSVREPGRGLCVSALSDDGVVEAIEDPKRRFLLLTQFHPELLAPVHEQWKTIFIEFKRQAERYRSTVWG